MNAHAQDLFAPEAAPRVFDDVPHPSSTPWGASQGWTKIAPGIWSCHTASHGGLWVSPQRRAAMPSCKTWAGGAWFEEDSDWHLVARAFPEAFSPEERRAADKTAEAVEMRKLEEAERAAAKASGNGWIRAAVCVDPDKFQPEHQERAKAAEAELGRLVFVLDDNDRRAIVADYATHSTIAENTPTGLDTSWLERLPF